MSPLFKENHEYKHICIELTTVKKKILSGNRRLLWLFGFRIDS